MSKYCDMLLPVTFLLLLMVPGCSDYGDNPCARDDVPPSMYIDGNPRYVDVVFEDPWVTQDRVNGYRCAVLDKHGDSYVFHFCCYTRSVPGGGPRVKDLWPVITAIGKDVQMFLPAGLKGEMVMILNPISERSRTEWYIVEFDHGEIEDRVVIPFREAMEPLEGHEDQEEILNLIDAAVEYRIKARS